MNKVWQIGFLLLFLWMGMTLSWELNRAVASENASQSGQSDQTVPLELFRQAFEEFVSQQPDLKSSEAVISRLKVVRNHPVRPERWIFSCCGRITVPCLGMCG